MNDIFKQTNFSPIISRFDVDFNKVSQIKIVENNEALVKLHQNHSEIKVVPIYARQGIPGALSECYVREEVYQRLLSVAQSLAPNYTLIVLDGWRPTCVQQYLFDTLKESIRANSPEIGESELLQRTLEFVALPISNDIAPSFHLTGGSVDVTLSDANGQILDLGSSFDEATPKSHTAYLENREQLIGSDRMAQTNRRRLYWAMLDQGFTNLASEWWHYDFGNQLWAYCSGYKRALYGPTKPKDGF